MADDRELLGWAAKAAGGEFLCCEVGGETTGKDPCWYFVNRTTAHIWNPLTDDGDALRLAVKLRIAVIPYPIYAKPKHSVIAKEYADSLAVYRGEVIQIEEAEVYGDDPAAATRRAIVRAAAAIGKGEKS